MITLTLNTDKKINISLQVGDAIYARGTETQPGADDSQATVGFNSIDTGSPQLVGILRRIQVSQNINAFQYLLDVDDQEIASMGFNPYYPNANDFIMFSKYTRGDSGVLGYYAEAKFVNNSNEKAEMFAVSSEIIINSK